MHDICDLVHTDMKQDNVFQHEGKVLARDVYESLNTTNVPRSFTSNLPKDKRKFKQPQSEVERASFEDKVSEYHRYLQSKMERLGVIEYAELDDTACSGPPSISDSNESNTKRGTGDFHETTGFCSYFRATKKKRCSQKDDFVVKIVDLGYSIKNEMFDFDYIQVREYRAAEVILGGKLSKAVDVWSTACIAFELATGQFLFDRELNDAEHLQVMTQVLGDIPDKVLQQCKHRDLFYTSDGKLLNKIEEEFALSTHLRDIGFPANEIGQFSDFLLSMLDWDVDERLTSAQCLQHAWLHM